jgi:ElaB/YqjD/DUF883 family membrane-anchored ribosome-binding protein
VAKEKIIDSLESVTKAQLIEEFKTLVADAEALLKATAKDTGASVSKVRARTEASLYAAKDKLEDLQGDLLEKGKAATKAADEYVHENPWKSVGIAAGLGLIVGLLISRR